MFVLSRSTRPHRASKPGPDRTRGGDDLGSVDPDVRERVVSEGHLPAEHRPHAGRQRARVRRVGREVAQLVRVGPCRTASQRQCVLPQRGSTPCSSVTTIMNWFVWK